MNQDIKKNSLPVYFKLLSVFSGGLLIFVVTGLVLRWINSVTIIDINFFVVLIRLLVTIGTLFAMLTVWVSFNRSKYTLTDEAIVVSRKGIIKHNTTYRFTNVNSISVKQGIMGSHYGYGDVKINMDRLESNVEVVLRNVVDPEAVKRMVSDQVR